MTFRSSSHDQEEASPAQASRFTSEELLNDVNISGKTVLVTGATNGLGLELAKLLAERGVNLIICSRDAGRVTSARKKFSDLGYRCAAFHFDLSQPREIVKAADDIRSSVKTIDIIVANAGIMASPYTLDGRGYELQFATNHLGHMLMIDELEGSLGSDSRVITLSSSSHRLSDINYEDPFFEKRPYAEFCAYGQSKTANALFALAYDNLFSSRGIRAAAVNPGMVRTSLGDHVSDDVWLQLYSGRSESDVEQPFKSKSEGLATVVWASFIAEAEAVGGKYCENCAVAPVDDTQNIVRGVRSYAASLENALRLWDLSKSLIYAE